jgi:hypothetical protein
MEVAQFKPEKIIAPCPEDKPGRIDNSRFAGIIGPDQNIQAAPELERQGAVRPEAPESRGMDFRNMHLLTPHG